MSASTSLLTDILQRPDIWRGNAMAKASVPGVPTGFVALDAELPGAGWPRGQLTELLHAHTGIGELSLLLPALAQLTSEGRHVLLVLPPQPQRRWHLHAPAWARAGVRLDRLLLVKADSPRNGLWAAVESLRCPGVAATVLWPDAAAQGPGSLAANSLRRLQSAAAEGGGCAFLLRPAACAPHASPAPLRLSLAVDQQGFHVAVLKRRGRPPGVALLLPVIRPPVVERMRHALAGSDAIVLPEPACVSA